MQSMNERWVERKERKQKIFKEWRAVEEDGGRGNRSGEGRESRETNYYI